MKKESLPPLVLPFRGERYAAADRLGALIAPPYDVISPEDRQRYAAADPHNIVHVMLPEAPAGGDRYARAAALLDTKRAASGRTRRRTPAPRPIAWRCCVPRKPGWNRSFWSPLTRVAGSPPRCAASPTAPAGPTPSPSSRASK